jgi:phosphate transport system permease protein
MNRRGRASVIKLASYAFSAVAAVAVAGMVMLFAWQSGPVWHQEGLGFITGKEWFYRQGNFGSASMIYGTLVLWLREWVYQILEPFAPLSGDSLLTAGILLAVMILPTVMTLAEDALRGVPASQRAAARALGLTATETSLHVSLPQAAPGIVAAILLSLGRAFGEMIAVFLVVGRQDNQWPASLLSLRPWLEAGQTLSSKLGGAETNIAFGDPVHWGAMVGLALILLFLVTSLTLLGARLRGFRHAT